MPDLAAPEGGLLDLGAPPAPPPSRAAAPLDQDLFTDDPDLFGADDADEAPPLEILPDPAATQAEDSMTDGLFAQELLSLVDDAFASLPTTPEGELAPPTGDLGPQGGTQIVISPLFKDFAVDEMVAVIQGLNLLTFEPRQIILREGAAGTSMYMLTAGTAKAYVRDPQGKQRLVGELERGRLLRRDLAADRQAPQRHRGGRHALRDAGARPSHPARHRGLPPARARRARAVRSRAPGAPRLSRGREPALARRAARMRPAA